MNRTDFMDRIEAFNAKRIRYQNRALFVKDPVQEKICVWNEWFTD